MTEALRADQPRESQKLEFERRLAKIQSDWNKERPQGESDQDGDDEYLSDGDDGQIIQNRVEDQSKRSNEKADDDDEEEEERNGINEERLEELKRLAEGK